MSSTIACYKFGNGYKGGNYIQYSGKVLSQKGIPLTNILAVATMTGRHKGFIACLKSSTTPAFGTTGSSRLGELIELTTNEELKMKFKNGYQEFWMQKPILQLYPGLWLI